MQKSNFLLLVAVLFLIIVTVSCGDNPVDADDERFGDVVIPKTTKVLDSATLQQLSSVSVEGRVLTFSSETDMLESLSPGDVIVSNVSEATPSGLLRKVKQVEQLGEVLVVTTEGATLEEALKEATIEIIHTLSPSQAVPGKIFPGVFLQRKGRAGEFFVTLEDVVLYDRDGNSGTVHDQIRANGSLRWEPSFHFSLHIRNFKLQQLTLTQTNQLTTELDLWALVPLVRAEEKIELFREYLTPITVWAGPVPIVITPVLTVNVGLSGEVSAGVTTGLSFETTLTAGLTYNNAAWDPISDFSTDFHFRPPTLSARAQVEVYAGPQLNLLLYGVAGPYTEVKGYSELEAELHRDPWWILYAGLKADAGVRVDVLGREIVDYEQPEVIGYRVRLAQAPGAFMQPGTIIGNVRDAATGASLGGVSIEVKRGETVVAFGTTDTDGAYAIEVTSAEQPLSVTFSKRGYLSTSYENLTVAAQATLFLETVLQIDEIYSGRGTISGRIVNALNGRGVDGLTVGLRRGINVTSGSIVETTSTRSDGSYSFSNLEAGHYTAGASGTGYNPVFFTVVCIGGRNTTDQDATVTPILAPGETRIILTWRATPNDLDSHLTGPLPDGTRFHMFFPFSESNNGSPYPDYVTLDLDDVTSFGPETTSLLQQLNGVYRFSVHDYSNRLAAYSTALSRSGAQVRVYRGGDLIASFNVPSNQDGTLWTVFEMNDNTVTPINAVTYESAPRDVRKRFDAPYDHTDAHIISNVPPKK